MKKSKYLRAALLQRVAALVLAMLLSFQLLPGTARAGDGTSGGNIAWKTLDNTRNTASAGQTVTNTYILEVSSGTRQGGGTAENVKYFIIHYTTAGGERRSVVLVPGEDAISRGFDAASAAGDRVTRRETISRVFGYGIAPLNTKKALGSVSADQYMFTTTDTVISFDKIQIFGQRNEEHGNWSCQGMRLYRVDTLYGLEMYGWYSDTGFIDFAGALVCDVVMPAGGVTFRWSNTAGMYELTPETLKGKLTMLSGGGTPVETQLRSRVVFRIDLADVAGAGFEALMGNYSAEERTRISDLKFCETAALSIRYTDIYGCIREITLPLVVNALGQAMEALGDAYIAEFAQQGDTVAIPAVLPFFRSLESVNISLGEEKAAGAAHMVTGSLAGTLRSSRVERSRTDDISYLCVAAYTDVTVQVGLEGATLRARFTGGAPVKLAAATSAEGVPLAADQTAAILLRDYAEGMSLIPRDRTERYLITLSTDNVPNAGTAGELYLQFTYISVRDKELVSAEYSVKEQVREFYGQWPGNVEDFAYYYGLRDGGTIQFMIPLQGVKEFKNVSVRVKGEDEWQFTGLNIAMVKSQDAKTGEKAYSPRLADWEEISVTGLNNLPQGLRSHLVYSRDVETEPVAFTVGTVYKPEEVRPDPVEEDSGWVPGALVQDDGDTYVFDGETQEVTKKDDVHWEQLRHYMTYNDAMQDLGFTKERCVYTVSVQVAGKTVNPGNDDCGSKNLFYFRLIFENGNSGCTLANQQIVGDAFGTGELVQFKIPCSQDLGEVVAVQVIPDSQDANSDIYDKLQIEEISVTRDTVDAVSPTWTAKIATAADEGWVGIDYRDQGEIGSNGGAQGRSLSELATTFPITETSYSTNLLVSITTANYDTGVQFSGGLGMELNFINAEGRMDPNPIRGLDVVEAMNTYGGLAGSRERRYKIGAETKTETVNYYVSDSRYQFLPGSTDSFVVTVKNVYQLTDMTLTVYSDAVTHWTIKDVNIFQLNGQGIRYLNAMGAYDYRYRKGEEPTLVATWTADRVTTPLEVYDSVHNSSIAAISFALDSETIKLSEDAAKWSSAITREPKSKNDTLNLILYPSTGSGAADPEDYEVVAAVKYTDCYTKQTLQVSTGQMRRGTDANGNTVFYATGLTASNLEAIAGVDWSATILRAATPNIPDGVLQVVRGGVLIESYPLTGVGYSLRTAVGTTAVSTQRLLLQVSEDTIAQAVRENTNDLAVALYYRTDDPSGLEYRSKYVFLSDCYDAIRPGQLLELNYSLGNVGELTGVGILTMGKLSVTFDGIYLADQAPDGAVGLTGSVRDSVTPVATPTRLGFGDSVSLLTLDLKTAEDTAAAVSGTKGPIRLNVGYYDAYGYAKTATVEDIRLHTASAADFSAGAEDLVRLLIPDMRELRWIELEPWHEKTEETQWSGQGESAEDLATWDLYGVTVKVGLDGREITRVTDQRIVECTPLRIGLSDIRMLGTVVYTEAAAEEGTPGAVPEESIQLTVSTGETKAVSLASGGEVKVSVLLSGTDESFDLTLQSVDPETGELGRAYIDETHGYTRQELETLLKQAEASAGAALSDAEGNAARAVQEAVSVLMQKTGKLEQKYGSSEFTFTPPRNYTGGKVIYRLTVSAKEMPEVSFQLDISVSSEADPLPEALEAWAAVRTAGVISVLNREGAAEETSGILFGEDRQLRLRSGGSLALAPHGLGEGSGFRASVQDLDPATGATGPADLGATHGYTKEKLDQLEQDARSALNDPESTAELRTAAQEVLDAVAALRDTQGTFTVQSDKVLFTAPGNYTGGSLYYRVTVTAEDTGETLFTVDVSVKAEENPLTGAMSRLETAKSNALIAKQTEALQSAGQSAGTGGGYGEVAAGGAAPDTGDTGGGDTGDTGGEG